MNRADTFLLYGATSTGKTAQLGEMAQWEWKKHGRISRLISADSGWDPLEHMVVGPERPLGTQNPDGSSVCIEAWNVQGLQNPWVILVELSEGAWPEVVQGPSGPRLRMKRPTLDKEGWILSADGKIVGQMLIEGLATIATVGMQDHINQARGLAQDVVKPFQSVVPEVDPSGKETSRSITLSNASMSHYGHVQRWLLDDLVPRFGRMPVSRVVWTSHEGRGTDDITGQPNSVLGPLVIGKAYTDKTTQKFGHSFHTTVGITTGKTAKGEAVISQDFRAWFLPHPDEYLTKMNWPAKVSLPIARSQELLRKYPGGFIPLNGGTSMVDFLEFLCGNEK